ncbi:MAG: ATP-binding protein, partial [Pyrinomonadaceae bacterium]
LQQVIGNLLSNAVKFTPGGGRIDVELNRLGQQAQIQVRDSGLGIDAELLPRIFDRFDQAGQTSTRRHGGLGLGLSLVHQLVGLHHGSVRAESSGEGKGATFVIQLPLRSDASTTANPTPARGPLGSNTGPLDAKQLSLAGFNILVVDDDPDARELTSLLLRQHGAEVRPAASAAEAFSTLAASADFLPDLLLSDIGMPDEDGYSLITRIRVLESASDGRIPAIALTAFGSNEDRARAFSSGFDAHLTKPVEPNQLIAEIARLAPQGKARRVDR